MGKAKTLGMYAGAIALGVSLMKFACSTGYEETTQNTDTEQGMYMQDEDNSSGAGNYESMPGERNSIDLHEGVPAYLDTTIKNKSRRDYDRRDEARRDEAERYGTRRSKARRDETRRDETKRYEARTDDVRRNNQMTDSFMGLENIRREKVHDLVDRIYNAYSELAE
ncbi:hypothetical protein HQ545_02235 [Candidatus Woesearchaeota archaeon]|nr:hypothetical protein [Candidatus Woesearchaeota archaeon]